MFAIAVVVITTKMQRYSFAGSQFKGVVRSKYIVEQAHGAWYIKVVGNLKEIPIDNNKLYRQIDTGDLIIKEAGSDHYKLVTGTDTIVYGQYE